jgi:hypothetical protein
MPETREITESPDLRDVPDDLREFVERLAAAGITVRLATVGPDTPLWEPLRLRTSLSEAIIEERDEYYD